MRARTSSSESFASARNGAWRWCCSVDTSNHHQASPLLGRSGSMRALNVRPASSKLNERWGTGAGTGARGAGGGVGVACWCRCGSTTVRIAGAFAADLPAVPSRAFGARLAAGFATFVAVFDAVFDAGFAVVFDADLDAGLVAALVAVFAFAGLAADRDAGFEVTFERADCFTCFFCIPSPNWWGGWRAGGGEKEGPREREPRSAGGVRELRACRSPKLGRHGRRRNQRMADDDPSLAAEWPQGAGHGRRLASCVGSHSSPNEGAEEEPGPTRHRTQLHMTNVDLAARAADHPRRDRERESRPATAWRLTLGASVEPGGVRFRVWAPATRRAEVVLYPEGGGERVHALEKQDAGYHGGLVGGLGAGTRYKLRLDGEVYPDPASRAQPEGVHGPSEVVDPAAFAWTDEEWPGLSRDGLVIYELHVGTFTPEGTFDAAIAHLDDVAALGANAIEVMPIASFPGTRNWGYDGVALFAPAAPYGGPEGFRRLVDAAHARGLGVILDVVYNHFGPEGNYLPAITGGHFFTERHKTPWGAGINYDGGESRQVRDFVLQNALHWAHEYHVDGLRLDATHAILDDSPKHLLRELADALHGLERPRILIAEDERNERRVLLPPDEGGYGLDAVWADDFHHQVRRLAAGDSEGYFRSYTGSVRDLVETMRKGWFYEGQVSAHTGEARGTKAEGLPPRAFVHALQNHDQVGNRALGDRLNHVVPLPVYRALTALLLTSPYTPMLWMGQEWAATAPFKYFTDHPPELGKLVTEGRREEFKHFSAFSDESVRDRIPDPQAEDTFTSSRLEWGERDREPYRGVLSLHRALLTLRRDDPALRSADRDTWRVEALGERSLALRRTAGAGEGSDVLVVVSLEDRLRLALRDHAIARSREGARWQLYLSTEEGRFAGGDGVHLLDVDGGTLEMSTPGAAVLRAAREGT